jgi:hypothetical protein
MKEKHPQIFSFAFCSIFPKLWLLLLLDLLKQAVFQYSFPRKAHLPFHHSLLTKVLPFIFGHLSTVDQLTILKRLQSPSPRNAPPIYMAGLHSSPCMSEEGQPRQQRPSGSLFLECTQKEVKDTYQNRGRHLKTSGHANPLSCAISHLCTSILEYVLFLHI